MDRVRIGIIGTGGIARWHLTNLAKIAEAEVAALCDNSPNQIELTKRQHAYVAEVPTYEDFRVMLQEADLDAVMICTPHDQHFDQLITSFQVGKHVFVEKPFVGSPEEALTSIRARDESGKVGLLAYQRHTQAEYRWIRAKIQAGAIGAVQGVSALLCQEWNRFTKGSWRQDPVQSGGGMLNDSGSHILDVLHWCTGLVPETVSAFGNDRNAPVDINSVASVRFVGGAIGSLTIMGDAQHWHEDFTIWGETGAFFMRNGKLTMIEEDGSRVAAEEIRGGSNPCANFVAAIQGREEVQSPFEAALPVLRLTRAIYESQANGGSAVAVGR